MLRAILPEKSANCATQQTKLALLALYITLNCSLATA